ncbi:MAG: hypothetical protein GY927_01530 [bacterium]|nr:hypothetical protein [bacterium]
MNFVEWEHELEDDPDRLFILDGIKNGFRIVNENSVPVSACVENYKSAMDSPFREKVEDQLLSEILAGNYQPCSSAPTIISALGAIPKPNGRDVRLIHDCSRPSGSAVNDYAENIPFRYQTLDDAVNITGKNYWLAKVDLKSAYRSVDIHPENYEFTGLQWTFRGTQEPIFLIDTKLPFGARLAPGIFNRLTQSVRRMMARKGFNVTVYLDDFYVSAPTRELCQTALNTLLDLLSRPGILYRLWESRRASSAS